MLGSNNDCKGIGCSQKWPSPSPIPSYQTHLLRSNNNCQGIGCGRKWPAPRLYSHFKLKHSYIVTHKLKWIATKQNGQHSYFTQNIKCTQLSLLAMPLFLIHLLPRFPFFNPSPATYIMWQILLSFHTPLVSLSSSPSACIPPPCPMVSCSLRVQGPLLVRAQHGGQFRWSRARPLR